MAGPQGLHPLQQQFLQEAALQCGFCTPGFLVAAKALLDRNPDPSETEIRFALAGNLCARVADRHEEWAAGCAADLADACGDGGPLVV